jgi:vancomycin resistance protein YoaR
MPNHGTPGSGVSPHLGVSPTGTAVGEPVPDRHNQRGRPAISEDVSTYANGRLIRTPGPRRRGDGHPDPHRVRHGDRRRHWLALVAVLGLAAALVLSVVLLRPRPDRVPPDTFVAGVAVGGLEATALTAVLESRVRPRVELPLSVTAGTDQFELSAHELGVALDVPGMARVLLAPSTLRDRLPWVTHARREVAARFTMSSAVAETTLDDKIDSVRHGPVNASIDLPKPKPVLDAQGDTSFTARPAHAVVHAGRSGQSVDMATAAAAIRAAVAEGRRAVTLDVRVVEPRVTTADVKGIDQLIGSFTTYHACCEPRVTNIHRIAAIIDGTVVRPGTTFSLNQASGERTAANGFVAAPAIADGELVQQFGGGVSQFSTTLFNATWFSGLPTLTHQPHSKYISRYPPGREATLDFATIDQVFRNHTTTPVIIRAATTGTSVTVALYGHTGARTVVSTTGPRLPRNGGGFSISVQRKVETAGQPTGTDTVRWTYTGFD